MNYFKKGSDEGSRNVEGIRWGEKQKPIINRSQSNENDTLLFPKKWCFKKNISKLVSGNVWT